MESILGDNGGRISWDVGWVIWESLIGCRFRRSRLCRFLSLVVMYDTRTRARARARACVCVCVCVHIYPIFDISRDRLHATRAGNKKKGNKMTDRAGREWYKWELCVLLAVPFCYSRIFIERLFFSSTFLRLFSALSSSSFLPPSPLNLLRALSPCCNFLRRDIHSRSRSVSAFSLTFIWNWNEIEISIRSQSDLGHISPVASSRLFLLPSCDIKFFLLWFTIWTSFCQRERGEGWLRFCEFLLVINISTIFFLVLSKVTLLK